MLGAVATNHMMLVRVIAVLLLVGLATRTAATTITPDDRTWVRGWDSEGGVHLQACVHAGGDVSVLGSFRTSLLFDGRPVLEGADVPDRFLARLSASGELKWIHALGIEHRFTPALVAGRDGSCLLVGERNAPTSVLGAETPPHPGRPHLILCVSPEGEVSWSQTLGDYQPGGTAVRYRSVRISGIGVFPVDNGYRVVGSYDGPLRFGRRHMLSAGTDWLVASLGTDGSVRALGRIAQDNADIARVVSAPGNRSVVGGVVRVAGKGTEVFVSMLPSRGPERWRAVEGGPWDDFLADIAVGPDGTVYASMRVAQPAEVAGSDVEPQPGYASIALCAWNSDGNKLWQIDAGAQDIEVGEDGNVYGLGAYGKDYLGRDPEGIPPSAGDTDLFLACYSPQGKRLWIRRDGGMSSEMPQSLHLLPDRRAVIVGAIGGTSSLAGKTVDIRGWMGGFVMNVPLPPRQ